MPKNLVYKNLLNHDIVVVDNSCGFIHISITRGLENELEI